MRKKWGVSVIAYLFALLTSGACLSHGLTMTTAEITLRNQNHLTMAIRTSLPALFNNMAWPNKPASFMHLMAEDGEDLNAFYEQLQQVFLHDMPISFAGSALISPNLRLPTLPDLRQQIEREIANSVLPSSHALQHDRSNYLVIYLDGFIPKKRLEKEGLTEVEVTFPPLLDDIMVSFNQPLVQTLSGTGGKLVYRERF